MAKARTFSVSAKNKPKVEVSFQAPESLEDPRWNELCPKDTQAAINDLAVQNLVIKIQGGARPRLDEGEAAVQKYVGEYTYRAGAGGGGGRRAAKPKLSGDAVKKGKFSKAQLEMLAAAGMSIEGFEAEEEPAAA